MILKSDPSIVTKEAHHLRTIIIDKFTSFTNDCIVQMAMSKEGKECVGGIVHNLGSIFCSGTW